MDKNELAADFFADMESVLHLINVRKQYPQRPYIRFIEQDFTNPLPLPDASFDLVLALYAAASKELELIAAITEHRETCEFIEGDLGGYLAAKKPRRGAAGTQHTLGRPEYERTAHYYVFRKVSPRSPGGVRRR